MDSLKSKFSATLLYWRSLLQRPFWALLGQRSSYDLSLLGKGDTTSSSSKHSNNIQRCKYDVFISFRGPDTRNNFVNHLYNHLIRKGIFVFKDDQRLQKGESLSPQLLQAIKSSRVSIIVFSKTYVESAWCLDEMAHIAECKKESKQIVFPIFYDVDPSDVRKQKGLYENAFVLHTTKFIHDPSKIVQWKTAMTFLAELVGWDVRNKPEFEEIENIIQEVIKSLHHKFSSSVDDLVGIQPRVEALERLLKLSSKDDGVRVLGICGMGGIGKTTHATILYDRISYQFDACCFIENVSKIYEDGGATAVQKQILHQTIGQKNLETYTSFEIAEIARNRLHNIKVLIVLDNVDELEQLEKLAINPKFLHIESRMIITTRNKQILKVYGEHVVHEVPLLDDNDARDFFYKKVFKTEDQNSSCVELIPEVLQYAQGLPLAIKVLGSFLCTRDAAQWRDALDRLHNNPDQQIMNVLQISVDGLQYHEKEIFLHVACFFKGEREDYVKRILDGCGLHPQIGIPSMIEKSLITIRNQEIHMHELLQELGKKIVQHQCPEEPELWSRIWLYKDFYHVSMTKSEADNVKAMVLNQKENISKCKAEGLSKLRSLQMLILYDKKFSGGRLNFLSNNLKYLLWHDYPFPSLPHNFEPCYLVELNMPRSSIRQLWKGLKYLPNLKRMDLSNSKYLKETPNFEGILNLERLDFTGCTNLSQIHPSIRLLKKLAFLTLRNCSSLISLHLGNVPNLCSLKVLHLSGCTKLKTSSLLGASNLEYLDMDKCTSLSILHESIGALEKLRFLSLRDCTNLISIPSNINAMPSIITLDLYGCTKLKNMAMTQTISSHCLKSLIFMDVSFCNLVEVPDAIGELRCLERLNLQGNNFVSVTSSIERIDHLAYLNLAHCHKLESIPPVPLADASLGGKYFTTVSGSRDHRSGLYIFDCPKMTYFPPNFAVLWLERLLKQPQNFRCGFDIIVPGIIKGIEIPWISIIPGSYVHQFYGGSKIRITQCDVDDNWIGFGFYVTFEVNNSLTNAGPTHHSFSSSLPHPLYLSFENECTEERFDMPLSLNLNKIDGSKHHWVIYISREHCHFIKTRALITFKACPGLITRKWGLSILARKGEHIMPCPLDIEKVEESGSSFGPKIQLPYNWFFSNEDEIENNEAKRKENDLSNLGL